MRVSEPAESTALISIPIRVVCATGPSRIDGRWRDDSRRRKPRHF